MAEPSPTTTPGGVTDPRPRVVLNGVSGGGLGPWRWMRFGEGSAMVLVVVYPPVRKLSAGKEREGRAGAVPSTAVAGGMLPAVPGDIPETSPSLWSQLSSTPSIAPSFCPTPPSSLMAPQ